MKITLEYIVWLNSTLDHSGVGLMWMMHPLHVRLSTDRLSGWSRREGGSGAEHPQQQAEDCDRLLWQLDKPVTHGPIRSDDQVILEPTCLFEMKEYYVSPSITLSSVSV